MAAAKLLGQLLDALAERAHPAHVVVPDAQLLECPRGRASPGARIFNQ